MLITVAICTRNRATSIAATLESLVACARPSAPWEVVVVDNGSTDDTAQIVAGFQSRLPLRRIDELTPGLSRARNTAVRDARGDYIVWTDDDVLVDTNWLSAYADAFARWPNDAVFGGPIMPRFEGNPPEWLPRVAHLVGGAYAARDLGPSPISLAIDGDRLPYGANFAVRAREQRDHLYDERVGRGAARSALGEESLAIEAVLRAGGTGHWIPAARVTHCIPPERQTEAFIATHASNYGALVEWRKHTGLPTNEPDDSTTTLRRRSLGAAMRLRLVRGFLPPERWIEYLQIAAFCRGRLEARARLAR